MSKHTPLPWADFYDDNGFFYVTADTAPSPYIVATGDEGIGQHNAAFIVRAVNSHDELLAALKELLELQPQGLVSPTHQKLIEAISKSAAAITKAETP